ncbi:MAG: hypothetical protein HUJ95_05795 [Bacteroidales bacterium]|nr:hypothetical protein [Bacteroidales bacterium]
MTTFKHHTALLTAVLIGCFAGVLDLHSQRIISLPADGAISNGTLPNGISYYIIPVTSEGKTADFTMVQRTMDIASELESGREALDSVSCFRSRRPIDFLADNGIFYSSQGYVYPTEKGVVYSFKDVPTVRGDAVVDSLLLMMNNVIASKSREVALSDFAIIVSGDIAKDKIFEKLKMLSLTIPPENAEKVVYPQVPRDTSASSSVNFSIIPSVRTRVEMECTYPRNGYKNNETILPLVSDKMSTEVTILLDARINSYLFLQGIPYSSISSNYVGYQDQGGDTKYRFSVFTDDEHVEQVIEGFSKMFSTTRKNGVPLEEIKAAESIFYEVFRSYSNKSGKESYTKLCLNAFLYNASLSSMQTRYDYLIQRPLKDSLHVRLFNRYLTQLYRRPSMSVKVYTGRTDLDKDSLATRFLEAWEEVDTSYVALRLPDIKIAEPSKRKVLTPYSSKQSSIPCSKYIFSNGLTVYYKKLSSAKDFTYKYYFPDALSSAADIVNKEGAFFSDLFFCRDDEFTENDYSVYLARHGITMVPRVTLREFSLSGVVATKQLDTLFKVFRRLKDKNELQRVYFDDYVARQYVTVKAVNKDSERTIIDSLVIPEYKYTINKTMTGLQNLSYDAVQAFYEKAMANMSKGTLFLVGSYDEDVMYKKLEWMLNVLPADGKKVVKQPLPENPGFYPRHGYNLHTFAGDMPRVDIQISSDLEYTSANFYLSTLSSLVMDGELKKAVIGTGIYLHTEYKFNTQPRGRFNFRIFSSPASEGALAAGDEMLGPYEVVALFRSKLAELSSEKISEKALAEYKALLLAYIKAQNNNPDFWINILSTRYILKKDFYTKYTDIINAITAEDVRKFILGLTSDSFIGYMVK